METVCNKLEKSMMEVKVTFTTEEWKKAQEKALDKLAKNVKMDGFRTTCLSRYFEIFRKCFGK